MHFGDIDHFATMVAGCESIGNGRPLTPDGKYTFAVLKLYAQPKNSVVHGNEGFIDTVKRGAGSIKKWFLSLLKAIGNFIKEITGHNKKQHEQDEKLILKQREEAKKQKTSKYEEQLIEALKDSFAEPLRLSEQVYEDVESSGYLDRDAFMTFNVNNLRIHSGYDAIKYLNSEAKDVRNSDTKNITNELFHLEKAINELSLAAGKEVNEWAEEDIQAEQRKDIAGAAFLLKKYTQVFGWYEDGLTRYYDKATKIKV